MQALLYGQIFREPMISLSSLGKPGPGWVFGA